MPEGAGATEEGEVVEVKRGPQLPERNASEMDVFRFRHVYQPTAGVCRYWKREYNRRVRRHGKTKALEHVERHEDDWNGTEWGAYECGHPFWDTW